MAVIEICKSSEGSELVANEKPLYNLVLKYFSAMVYFFWVGMLLSMSVNGPLLALLSSTCTKSTLSVMVNLIKAMGHGSN